MVKINNLSVSFGDESIYRDFSLTLRQGEKLAVTGKSGRGKSTLLNLLVGFIPDYSGDISVGGVLLSPETVNDIRRGIAWLPQDTSLNFNTVKELFFAPYGLISNKDKNPSDGKIREIFDQFELSENILDKNVKNISGGQKQRVILASCLLLQKPLLLVDEPTSALDEGIKKKVSDYILGKKEITVIAATHDKYWIDHSDSVISLT